MSTNLKIAKYTLFQGQSEKQEKVGAYMSTSFYSQNEHRISNTNISKHPITTNLRNIVYHICKYIV